MSTLLWSYKLMPPSIGFPRANISVSNEVGVKKWNSHHNLFGKHHATGGHLSTCLSLRAGPCCRDCRRRAIETSVFYLQIEILLVKAPIQEKGRKVILRYTCIYIRAVHRYQRNQIQPCAQVSYDKNNTYPVGSPVGSAMGPRRLANKP